MLLISINSKVYSYVSIKNVSCNIDFDKYKLHKKSLGPFSAWIHYFNLPCEPVVFNVDGKLCFLSFFVVSHYL